jgi:uncharacterized membrane protein YgcG
MNLVAPNFEAGNFDEGVKQGTMALISYAGGEQFGEVTKKVNDAENTTGLTIMLVLIVAGVIVVLFVFGRWLCWPIFSGRGASDNW